MNEHCRSIVEESALGVQENQQLVELASLSAVKPRCLVVHPEPALPDPYDVLSEDEGDIETVQRNSLSKVASWDDGSTQLVKSMLPNVELERKASVKSTSERFSHIPIEQ